MPSRNIDASMKTFIYFNLLPRIHFYFHLIHKIFTIENIYQKLYNKITRKYQINNFMFDFNQFLFRFILHSIKCGGWQSAHANFNGRCWNPTESNRWFNISILYIGYVFADKSWTCSMVVRVKLMIGKILQKCS